MAKPDPTTIDMASDTTGSPCDSLEKEPRERFDDRGRTVPWMTRTLHRLYNVEAQKILDRERVSIAHWYYLRVLAERGELNQLELSKRVGIASTTAVPALDSMEKRGLITRTRDPKDRRKYYVGLTDDGRRLVDELMPAIIRMISGSFDGVTTEERCIFWQVMHQIAQNLTERSSDGTIVD
ncbi:MarR family transcriptional regulator [Paraburkholderia sediminicola]|uniref:MarR family transcriptional regulator n=1 Tax=Paraburkholderia rhynchosiae TaxID=487049 RepID=A0ACC7NH47_9BURK